MKRLGILGGMGPAASAEFVIRLIQQTPAVCDQEHIPFVLWNDPTVPDRSTSLCNGDDKPLPYLLNGLQVLLTAGCDVIVMPCNTAHFWFAELSKKTRKATIIHIVDSVADALREVKVTNATIGIMGTQATIELGLYQYRLNKLGWNCIVPSTEEMDTLVQPAINLIKANKMDEAHHMLMQVVSSLIDKGAKSVILGCTEIPLVIRDTYYRETPLINSIDSLVKAVLNKHASK